MTTVKGNNRSEVKARFINSSKKTVAATEEAKRAFKAGEISTLDLWRQGSLEKVGYWITCSGIMNVNGGAIEAGKLVSVCGNYEYLTRIRYTDMSIVTPYRSVYYTSDGTRHEVNRVWRNYDWTTEMITALFDVEFIGLVRTYGSKHLNRRMDRLMKMLAGRYPDLDLAELYPSF